MKKNKVFTKKILLVLFVLVLILNLVLLIPKLKERNFDSIKTKTVQSLRSILNENIITKDNSCINAKLGIMYFKKGYYYYAKNRFIEVLEENSLEYPCRYERLISEKIVLIRKKLPKIVDKIYKPLITIYLAEGKTEEADLFLQISNQILVNQKYETITNEELKNEISNEHILALPYLQYSTEISDKNKIGVVTYNKEFTYEGYM